MHWASSNRKPNSGSNHKDIYCLVIKKSWGNLSWVCSVTRWYRLVLRVFLSFYLALLRAGDVSRWPPQLPESIFITEKAEQKDKGKKGLLNEFAMTGILKESPVAVWRIDWWPEWRLRDPSEVIAIVSGKDVGVWTEGKVRSQWTAFRVWITLQAWADRTCRWVKGAT